jgi:NADPH:quinone reductase-like Zn-dependent oxidoreductase
VRAVKLTRHGEPDVLKLSQATDPKPLPGEVLVKVGACGINALDIYVRRGGTETTIPLPLIPGADIAGTVSALGEGVKEVRVGDRVVVNPRIYCGRCIPCLRGQQSACLNYQVLGWHRNGGYAEYVAVPADHVANIGSDISFEVAAAAPVTFTTAWRMLVSRAQVRPGERVLILGASGGVGTAAMQVARVMGARVAAVTSSPAKVRALEELGADSSVRRARLRRHFEHLD